VYSVRETVKEYLRDVDFLSQMVVGAKKDDSKQAGTFSNHFTMGFGGIGKKMYI
jgi:hypothetical protein